MTVPASPIAPHRIPLRIAAAALALAACVGAAAAHSYKVADIAIGHIWASPPAPGADGVAVYVPILNRGKDAVTLVGVATPVAASAGFRRERDGTVTALETIEIPSMKPVSLAAWREHIWLSGLTRPLEVGDGFPLTLDFGAAGSVEVEVEVEAEGQQH